MDKSRQKSLSTKTQVMITSLRTLRHIFTALLVLTAVFCSAQPDLPTDPAPIGGGTLLIAAAAGLGYGVKRYKQKV